MDALCSQIIKFYGKGYNGGITTPKKGFPKFIKAHEAIDNNKSNSLTKISV
jgi:hypothetical protein